jgi:homeobox-leucine zipper protein
MMFQLPVSAMEELIQMAQQNEPLWIHGLNGSTDPILNKQAYLTMFQQSSGPRALGLRSEASRETSVIFMNRANIIQILMDVVYGSCFLNTLLTVPIYQVAKFVL